MKLFDNICRYIKSNKLVFAMVIMIFISGVAFGGYTLLGLTEARMSELKNYTDKFFSVNVLNLSDRKAVFQHNLFESIKIITLIWVSGFYVFLIPVSLVQIFLKGFRCGFTIAYLIGVYGLKGMLYSFFNYFSGNLILLPLIILFTVYCIKNSASKNKLSLSKKHIPQHLIVYAVCVLFSVILSLFDGYIIISVLRAASAINI